MLYGTPTKFIRHVDETTITLEPQRFSLHTCWRFDNTATTRTDGLDLQNSKGCPLGSKILSHKLEILITPETIEPQQVYIGRIKLSFNDVYSFPLIGGRMTQASFESTGTFVLGTTTAGPQLWPEAAGTDKIKISGADVDNLEIGTSGSGQGITEWKLSDDIKHWINLKKVTIFDQRPLMGDRKQRIPSKVKRINSGTYYGIFFFNDSVRGGTPADTQIKINLKETWNEKAI